MDGIEVLYTGFLLTLTVLAIWLPLRADRKRSQRFEFSAQQAGLSTWSLHGPDSDNVFRDGFKQIFLNFPLPKHRGAGYDGIAVGTIDEWKIVFANYSHNQNPPVSHTGPGPRLEYSVIALSKESVPLPLFTTSGKEKLLRDVAGFENLSKVGAETLAKLLPQGFRVNCNGRWLVMQHWGASLPTKETGSNFIEIPNLMAIAPRSSSKAHVFPRSR
jgi:hypothetical protein